jgi:hypothetical protein
VKRLCVSDLSYADAWRLHICEVAEHSLFIDRLADIDECYRLGIAADVRKQLANLLYEAIGPLFKNVMCGLEDVDIVGITADGAFLYAKPGEYEIAPQTRV